MVLERLVQLSFVTRQMDKECCFHLLVELYLDEPDHLYQQFQAARNIHVQPDKYSSGRALALNQNWEPWNKDPRYQETLRVLKDLDLDLSSALRYRQFAHFLMDLQPVKSEKMASFKRLAIETAALVHNRYQQSETFRRFVVKDWHPANFIRYTNGSTPFVTGLRRILSPRLTRFTDDVILYIRNRWPRPRHDRCLVKVNPQGTPSGRFDKKPFQLLFASSGSGKTNAVLKELTQYYGHYLVSSTLPRPQHYDVLKPIPKLPGMPSWMTNDQSFFDPKVLAGVPRDTNELFMWLKYVWPLVAGIKDSDSFDHLFLICSDWWRRIMETRHRIFRSFCEALQSHSSPALWLSFQLDCHDWDPFVDIFRVLALFGPSVASGVRGPALFSPEAEWELDHDGRPMGHLSSAFGNDSIEARYLEISDEHKVRWACIDEAQEDLQTIIADKASASGGSPDAPSVRSEPFVDLRLLRNMLAIAMNAVTNSHDLLGNFTYFHQMIFTGTSLNVNRVLQSRASILASNFATPESVWGEDACTLTSDFPLVLSRSTAREVLRSYGLDGSEVAVENSISLWGRVKWTAMYAERIIDEIKKGQPAEIGPVYPEEDLEKLKTLWAIKQESLNFGYLAGDTYEVVIAELLTKLHQLQKRGDCERLLDNLLEAAFSADILDRPHVLNQESDMELVEHGFAIVESWKDSLEAELTGDFKIEKSGGQMTATLRDDRDSKSALIHLLDSVIRRDLAVVSCRINTLSANIMNKGFVIADRRIDRLAAKLEEHSFAVSRQVGDRLVVRLINSGVNAPRRLNKLAAALVKNGAFIENHTMDKLTAETMRSGFTLWSDYRRDGLNEALKTEGFEIIDQIAGCSIIKRVDAQESDKTNLGKTNLGKTIDRWRTKLKKKVVLFNADMGQLLTEWSSKGFTIKADPAVSEQLKQRLTRQNLQDGVISEPESRLLPAKSSGDAGLGDHQRADLLSNLNRDGFIIVDQDIESLIRLVKEGMTVMRPTNKMTADMWENSFITWGGTAQTQLRTLLEPCAIMKDRLGRLSVTGPSLHTLDSRDRLADELAKDGFPMISKTNHSLILKLAERVVIDAVIRFALSHGQLNEKFATLIRLVSGRTGLGHLAELYLAVQLRQCLSTRWTEHSAGPENEWLFKYNTVLTMLGKAKNGQGNTIESLDQYFLVPGRQTIKSSDTWDDWMDTFLDWLAAVGEHRRPNASFLFPHNDFGPDIVFALRKEKPTADNDTVGAKKYDVIVCSIQSKTKGAKSDAVNKSSVSWACNSARTKWKDKLEKQRQPLEDARQELKHRKDDWNMDTKVVETLQQLVKDKLHRMDKELGTEGEAAAVINTASLQDLERAYTRLEQQLKPNLLKLSLLIATDADADARPDLDNARPDTSPRDERKEYFAFIVPKDVKAVFGSAFTTLLTTI